MTMEYLPENSFATCDVCGYSYMPAPSKRAGRCPNCEHHEKHGVTIFEAKKKKQMDQVEASRQRSAEKAKMKPVVRYEIPKASAKGKIKAAKIAAVKTSLKSESKTGEFSACGGCGQYFRGLDASHKVPLSQSSLLADAPENIRLLCRRCHEVWEHWPMPALVDLHCFFQDMAYLHENDSDRFWKILFHITDYANENPTKELDRVLRELEGLGE